jgi:hypothetical protein
MHGKLLRILLEERIRFLKIKRKFLEIANFPSVFLEIFHVFLNNRCYLVLADNNYNPMIFFKKIVTKHEISYFRSCKILAKILARSKNWRVSVYNCK